MGGRRAEDGVLEDAYIDACEVELYITQVSDSRLLIPVALYGPTLARNRNVASWTPTCERALPRRFPIYQKRMARNFER